jgi:DNA-binding HxlR family transcriptional regulator
VRTYDDPCGIARALDHVGERWALLIVRELLLGPKRFTDLRTGLPGASQNVLSQRLRELEESGLVRRRTLPPPAASRVYELTARGHDLEPVVLALAGWGSRAPLRSDRPLSDDALMYALKSTFDPVAAEGFEGSVELRLGEHRFLATVTGGRLGLIRAGDGGTARAVVRTDAETLRAVVFAGADPGTMDVEGDRAMAERFLRLFPRPAMSS